MMSRISLIRHVGIIYYYLINRKKIVMDYRAEKECLKNMILVTI